MRALHGCIVSCVVAGCMEPTASIDEQITLPPPITGDTCTPAPGNYLSCEAALAAAGTTSGCFTILSHGFPSQPVTRSCERKSVLVLQVYDGATQPATDQTYLDTVLDSLTSFIGISSYGRASLSLEVAGDQTDPITANRWIPAADSHCDQIQQLAAGQSQYPLDHYDIFLILSTADDRGVEVGCDLTVGSTVVHKPVSNVFTYRKTSDPTYPAKSAHHEVGHAFGLQHDHALSSASGWGTARTTFEGSTIQYGGRSSVMGANNDSHYSLPERIKLGWLNDGIVGGGRHVVEVDAAGGAPVDTTVTFDTLAQDVEAIKGVYIPTATGNYWIEARRDADMDPVLTTGVIIHYSDGVTDNQMIDGTPETPSDVATDATLPIGRTYGDFVNGVYITARSEDDSSATVEIHRDPVDPNPPVITSVTATNCTTSPAKCPGAPPPPPAIDWWRYEAKATDADGDPLSYSWRFGIGTNGTATVASYDHTAVVFREKSRIAPAERVFVTVSDRKGRDASSFVNEPGYRSGWVGPSLASVGFAVVPVDPKDWRADNEMQLQTTSDPTGTELLDYAWTIGAVTTAWIKPIIDPAPLAPSGASAPTCIDTELRVHDTSNCVAEPVACVATANACVPVPLRLTYAALSGPPTVPPQFSLALTYDPALFNGNTPNITWSKGCAILVAADKMSAVYGSGCKVKVTLDQGSKTYAATVTPH